MGEDEKRGSKIKISNFWKKVDIFDLKLYASPLFLRIFYILLGIGVITFFIALILFLVPTGTTEDESQIMMEEVISYWSYSRVIKNLKFL